MKNKKLLALVIILALFLSSKVSAQDICSKTGYTVLTMNGIFTNKEGAILNKNALRYKLSPTYKNQPITVDYVYNATHLAGVLDLVDAVRQGLFDSGDDYDLVEMLSSASSKVTTQKLLLVGHSQGNFYANNFYDKVAGEDGGVPFSSIGVYSVASPDDHVAGGGKYLTSDTDGVIALVVGRLKNILKPNTHIDLQKIDGNGHDFSDVYLKYRSEKIVSDIKSSFDKLETNDTQVTDMPCISPQKVSILHEINGVILAIADFTINTGVKISSFAYNTVNKAGSSLASTLLKIAKDGLAAVGFADDKEITPILAEATSDEVPMETGSEIIPVADNLDNKEIIKKEDTVEKNILKSEVPLVIVSSDANHDVGGNSTNTVPVITDPAVLDITPPLITLLGKEIEYHSNGITYVDSGATAIDIVDGVVPVVRAPLVRNEIDGSYIATYTATDKAGNISTKTRLLFFDTYVYSDKYNFGTGNGDGKDWKIWYFNNSAVFDWSDTYVNKYLHEEFKIEAWKGDFRSSGLMRGIFYRDPKKGYGEDDIKSSSLESSSYDSGSGLIYNIVIQWDPSGYITTVSQGGVVISSRQVSVANISNDTWVGWTSWGNYFRQPVSGDWVGVSGYSETGLAGGQDMIITPYLVHDESKEGVIIPPVIVIPLTTPVISGEKNITSFSLDEFSPKVIGIIDEVNSTISLTVPYGTDVSVLRPTITISDKAHVSPNSLTPTSFLNPYVYEVGAEDYSTKNYTVTVNFAPYTPPIVVGELPTIVDYSFNGNKSNFTINPVINNLNIVLTANKNVEWKSVYVQSAHSSAIYKTFRAGVGCLDFTNTCTKVWNGELSSGGLLQNEEFVIRAHIEDAEKNSYETSFPTVIMVEGQ